MYVGHDVLPELEGFKHICFVDRGEPLAALLRGLKRNMRNTTDFRLRVTHGVEAFARALERAVWRLTYTTRLAEVNIAVQLTHNQNIQTRNNLRLK